MIIRYFMTTHIRYFALYTKLIIFTNVFTNMANFSHDIYVDLKKESMLY